MVGGKRQPLDLIDVIGSHQLPRTSQGKIGQRVDTPRLLDVKRPVDGAAIRVDGQCRVRLVTDARLDTQDVVGIGDIRGRRLVVEFGPVMRVKPDLRHVSRGQRHQAVGALQKMVLQWRLVDLRNERPLIRAVGARRIEMLWALGKRAVEDRLCRFPGAVRIIPGLVGAAGQHRQRHKRK